MIDGSSKAQDIILAVLKEGSVEYEIIDRRSEAIAQTVMIVAGINHEIEGNKITFKRAA